MGDVVGTKFGRLTVIRELPSKKVGLAKKRKRRFVECRCICGVRRLLVLESLRRGLTKSCGCFRREFTGKKSRKHGMRSSPEWGIWRDMRKRCRDPNHKNYKRYGGRGITVSKEWDASFAVFFRDMGLRPSRHHSVERKNNDGPYCKENCKWATRVEQARNKSNTVMITVKGVTRPLTAWAEQQGFQASLLHCRLRRGWTPEEAVLTPIGGK